MAKKSSAEQFAALHAERSAFVMGNAWDAGTAAVLEAAGIRAIGTTSAGIAYSRALPDYEGALSFDEALEATRRIVNAVSVPVSMDSENAYAHDATGVHDNMRRIAETGVAGASIEDYTGDAANPHYEISHAADRVCAARDAVSGNAGFMLTARSECVLTGQPNGLRQAIDRVNAYAEAGANCVFVPGIRDIPALTNLLADVDVPVSVLIGLKGEALTVSVLQELGVSRISIGGSLARAALGLVRSAAREMLDRGTFSFASDQISDEELCAFFSPMARR